jgi:hypothetical protein
VKPRRSTILPEAGIELTLSEVRLLIEWAEMADGDDGDGMSEQLRNESVPLLVRLRKLERGLLAQVRQKRDAIASGSARPVLVNMRSIRKAIK